MKDRPNTHDKLGENRYLRAVHMQAPNRSGPRAKRSKRIDEKKPKYCFNRKQINHKKPNTYKKYIGSMFEVQRPENYDKRGKGIGHNT